MDKKNKSSRGPGVCLPWEEKIKDFPEIQGDKDLVKKVLNELEKEAQS